MYDKNYGEFPVGEVLYTSHLHFCCPSKIYASNIIREIKGIKYCKESGTPPYPTLADTPFEFIQKFENNRSLEPRLSDMISNFLLRICVSI